MASENSVITLARRVALRDATSQGSAVSPVNPITHIEFGSGGVDSEGNPIPPSETQTTLNSPLGSYPLDAEAIDLDPATARYSATIPADDLAGAEISEAGLIDSAGMLCAVKNMYIKRKDAGVTFTFTFDDEF